ncbi:hypothetical protein OWV82_006842 [Melia azedarach]|uniref:Uncharacterized protein n=1 Tax=Melia azedarach TaxID=155640 RepID=A0ACC1YI64_MELAZ|nr:hypothetical protein OWV82_006842 [Melia azedarach]
MTNRYYHEYQHGSSSSSSSSPFHAPQTYMEPSRGSILLLNSKELEIARSWPEMFSEYSLLCNGYPVHHCYKTLSSSCQCGFCSFEGKYGFQFQRLKELFDRQNLQEDGRFLVTSAKTGSNLIRLCSSQEEVTIAVPSFWELNEGQHCPIPPVRISLFQDNRNHQQISPPLVMSSYQAAPSVRSRERASSQGFVLAPFIDQPASSSGHNFGQFSVVDIAADDDYGTIHHRRDDEEKPRPSNQTRLVEAFIMMAVQTASVVGTGSSSDSSTSKLSHNTKILSYFCIACNIIGFIMFLYRLFLFGHRHGEHGRAARVIACIIGGLGYTSTAFGFIAVAAMRLHDSINLRIATASCVIAFPALARTFVY